MSLSNQVAIVTGSSAGIGRATALRLAQDGADICINYAHNVTDAGVLQEDIIKLGRRAIVVQADVSQVDQARRLISETVTRLGRVDILVNNAGIEVEQPFLEVSEENYDRVLSVNLKGAFFCAQAAAQQMVHQGQGGRIINISSVHEDLGMPGNSPYCASKGGMRMMMRTIAVELAKYKITVNDVCPGAIATPINRKTLETPELLARLEAEIPLGYVGTPEAVAGLVSYLASPEASYVTGSSYVVDGGLSRQSGAL